MTIAELNYPVPGNVERIVKDKGLKKAYVAEKAKLTSNAFSDMLNGRRLIRPCEVTLIAAAMDVTPNELFQTATS